MDTSLSSPNFYFLLAVFQGFVLSLLIIFKKPNRKPDKYFGILIFLISLALLHSRLEESIHAFNSEFPVPMDFGFAYGPLAYLHILHIKDPLRKFKRNDIFHFLPSLLLDVVCFTLFFLYIGNNIDWADKNIPLIQSIGLGMAFIGIIQLAIYTYFIFKESKETQPVLKEFEELKKWLSSLVISWSTVIGFFILAVPISLVFIEQLDDNSEWLYKPLGIILALWIYVLGYMYLLKYSNVLGKYMDKISKFKFSANEIHDKRNQLLDALNKQELYKDPKITLAKLAGHLGWPINSASKMINETLQSNFNDLINQYRVEAFKQISLKPESKKFSILGLGQEVGFSSKASFYRVFKKETGMTPSEFIKSQG